MNAGKLAQARRFYHHALNGGTLTPDDVSFMVVALEEAYEGGNMKDFNPDWLFPCTCGDRTAFGVVHMKDEPCYYPEKRGWVGLTNKEIQEIADRIKVDDLLLHTSTWHLKFARAVQRKLKEKNT